MKSVCRWRCMLVGWLALAGAEGLEVRAENEGGSWTNLAGHALRATPMSLEGKTVTFQQGSSGKLVSYPLSVFPPLEQERLRVALKDASVPEGLQSAYIFTSRILKRSRLLYEQGQIPEEDYRKSMTVALAAFRAQAAPLLDQGKLSGERLEIIESKLTETVK